MKSDLIEEVRIDADGRLHVKPASARFLYIYREAMEVHWDADAGTLHSPVPREWSHARWFQQMLAAATEQGCTLRLSEATRWVDVPREVRDEIELGGA
jgi:hypothetical protein